MRASHTEITRLRTLWPLTFAIALSGSPAEAHLVTTGLGPIYDGISHFFMSPEDIVAVFVLALLAGQRGPEASRLVLFGLPAAWLVGGLAGSVSKTQLPAEPTWLTFILLGGMVAARLRPPNAVILGLAVLLGLFKGYLNVAPMSAAGVNAIALTGVAPTVFVVIALASAATIALAAPPAKIAIRVLGSWTAATGILMFGWSLR